MDRVLCNVPLTSQEAPSQSRRREADDPIGRWEPGGVRGAVSLRGGLLAARSALWAPV